MSEAIFSRRRSANAEQRKLRLSNFEPGDRLRGGAGDLGDDLAAGVGDAEGSVGVLDGHGRSSMGDTDTDALAGDGELAAAADPPLHPDRLGGWLGFRAGRADIPKAGPLVAGGRVGQGAQQRVPLGQMRDGCGQ
ncbi:hypothetical protein ACIBP6_33585 [Nonomuraea terrae]|uniref:hypothetical protein n=1 Tax=Nonomuraea terrae TaxID=2530383 RepID=UPI0037B218DC